MRRVLAGPALVLGHDVNTDELHPSCFYSLDDARVRSGFLGAVPGRVGGGVASGHVIVAGRNFGVGSSRETGARVFLLSGVQAVIAESYGRIFMRNVVNLGLPALTCAGLSERVVEGDLLTVDLDSRTVTGPGWTQPLGTWDPAMEAIMEAGGLLAWLGVES